MHCAWLLASGRANCTSPSVNIGKNIQQGWNTLPSLAYRNLLWPGTIYQYLLEKHQIGNFYYAPEKNSVHSTLAGEMYFAGVCSLAAYFLFALPKASSLRNWDVLFLFHSEPYFTPNMSWDCFFADHAELTHPRILPCKVSCKCRWINSSIYLSSRCTVSS